MMSFISILVFKSTATNQFNNETKYPSSTDVKKTILLVFFVNIYLPVHEPISFVQLLQLV